jgi:hypothetical protein
MDIFPFLNFRIPARIFIKVDLPDPFGPMTVKNMPCSTLNEIVERTLKLPYEYERECIAIAFFIIKNFL